MTQPYRIYGAEVSPYSVKVRSYFRYKGIPHQWLVRNTDTIGDYKKHAKIPIIPLVVTPDEQGIQDSTPILERLEAENPKPSIHPDDPALAFVSALVEEFGDEWGNKWMFHYRWARPVDQDAAAGRIARSMAADADDATHAGTVAKIKERMTGRVWFVGSNAETAPQIESTFREALALYDAHLASRPYLFGGRPSFGDFGLWPQLYEAWTDPTPGGLIEGGAHRVLDWILRMTWPTSEGDFESWESLEPTLLPILQQIGRLFLPWTLANEKCVAAGEEEFTVELEGRAFTQKPQKYHAKSLAVLREKYAACSDKARLDPILERAGCRTGLD